MEVAGFALSTVALVSLFDTVVDILNRVDTYRTFGDDYSSYKTGHDIALQLLRDWGAQVGIVNGQLLPVHSSLLNDSARRKLVIDALNNIQRCAENGARLVRKFAQNNDPDTITKGSSASFKKSLRSTYEKTSWSISGKSAVKENTETLLLLVEALRLIIPVDTPTTLSIESNLIEQQQTIAGKSFEDIASSDQYPY